MRRYLPAIIPVAIGTVLFASPVVARSAREIATIKAASDCVAAAALNNSDIVQRYQDDDLKPVTDWIVLKSKACKNALDAMVMLHDRLYGSGTGRVFLRGDYLDDLPRAVRERIGPEIDKRIADQSSTPDKQPPVVAHGGDESEITFRVIRIAPNDVLMMRKHPTSESAVVDTIPPNGRGIQYLGQTSGDWLFVHYDRARGWVHSRYVKREQPPLPEGGRDDG